AVLLERGDGDDFAAQRGGHGTGRKAREAGIEEGGGGARHYRRYNARRRFPIMKLRITTVGNSAGVVLPKELLARLRLDKGDTLYLTETLDGFRLLVYDPGFAAQMDVAERVMRKRSTLLHKLSEN